MIRCIAAFMGAVLSAYVVGAFVSTQMVLNAVATLGVPVGAATRAAAVLHDLPGMAPVYGPMIAIAFLIAFPVAALVMRFVPGPRTLGYVLAGAAALLAVHSLIPALLGMHMLPATRSLAGLAWQVAAGALGGYVFGRLCVKRSAATDPG